MSSEIAKLLISRILGEYLENVDSENIAVGLWSGRLTMDNLMIKSSALDKFHLPIKLKYGKIDKLHLQIPYKQILMGITSKAEIFIENIILFSDSNPKENWEFFDYTDYNYKKNLVKSFTENLLLKIRISKNPKLNNTYINRMLNNIIDNIHIKISNMIVIHKDTNSHNSFNFYFGLKCKEIRIDSKELNDIVYSRTFKELNLTEFSIFLIPYEKDKSIKFELDFGKGNIKNDLYNLFDKDNDSSSNVIEYFAKVDDNYIIKPINLKLDLRRDENYTNYKLDINIDNIEIHLERKQFACILKIIDFINNYDQFNKNNYFYRRLKIFKPELKLIDQDENDLTYDESYDILEQNKALRKKFCINFLRHYFRSVLNLVKEKKYRFPIIMIKKHKLDEMNSFFMKNYRNFYINEKLLNNDEINMMKEVLKYVDFQILNLWIKDVITDIYIEETRIDENSGFFGGIKSYFLKSAIDNIKNEDNILVNIKENKKIFNISLQIALCGFTISNQKHKNSLSNLFKIYEISNFQIKNTVIDLKSSSFENEDILKMEVIVNEFKMLSITRINETFFSNDIIIPINKNEKEDIVKIIYEENNNQNSKNTILSFNLLSHALIYNHNFIYNIQKFFNITEFDQYSNHIKSQDFLNIELDLLQNYNIENTNLNKSINRLINVRVNNQKIVLPFRDNNTNYKDVIILNFGDFTLQNNISNNNIYIAESQKINIEYYDKFSHWIEIHKKNSVIEDLNTFKIVNEFHLKFELNLEKIKFLSEFSDINFNLDKITINKILTLHEVFKTTKESDIWDSVYQTKLHIFNNSKKRGAIMLKNNTNVLSDQWIKHYCLLSGGYLYLYKSPDNLKPDRLISLKNADILGIVNPTEENMNLYLFSIIYKNSSEKYIFGFQSELVSKDWMNNILSRIEEIRFYSNQKENEIIINNKEKVPDEEMNVFNKIEKIKSIVSMFKSHENLPHRIDFEFNLNYLGGKLLVSSQNCTETEYITLEFIKFNLRLKNNELLTVVFIDLSQINIKYNCKHFDFQKDFSILSNQLEHDEKLIKITIKIINSEIFETITNDIVISNELNTIDKILSYLGTENDIVDLIKSVSKLEVTFNLSKIAICFDPVIINKMYNFVLATLDDYNGHLNNCKLKQESKIIEDHETYISDKCNNEKLKTYNFHKNPTIKVSANFKSFDFGLINKKIRIKTFSFILGESSIEAIQFNSYFDLKLNLGNFQIYEHFNFRKNIIDVHTDELLYDKGFYRKEIIGLVDNNKSSLKLDMLIFSDSINDSQESFIRKSMKVNLVMESIKINFDFNIILKILDSVLIDVIDTFNNFNTPLNIPLQIECKEIETNLTNDNHLNFVELNILINNPTIFIYNENEENISYKLDFGKIYITNSIELVENNSNLLQPYYYKLLIEFRNTKICSWDNLNICEPLSIMFTYSSLDFIVKPNKKEFLIFNKNHPKIIIDISVKIFEFKIRKLDYINIFKIIQSNFISNDDDTNELFFEKYPKNSSSKVPRNQSLENFETNLNLFEIDIKIYNKIFKCKIIDNHDNYLQLYLNEFNCDIKKFSNSSYYRIISKNIFIKDNSISVVSNKKGSDKFNLTNYSQFTLGFYENYIINEIQVDILLIDLKLLLKLDLINFIQSFFNLEKETTKSYLSNQSEKINTSIPKMSKISILNISILNNVIFFKSQNHFSEQDILALEGDIISKIYLYENPKITDFKYKNINYEEFKKNEINLTFQNIFFYTSKILSFESDFEKILNKRKLIEPLNLFCNIITNSIRNINEDSIFEKSEIYIDVDSVKFQISYNDYFLIFKSVIHNMNLVVNEDQNLECIKAEKKTENKIIQRKYQDIDNNTEIFIDIKSIEILIINDLNNILCPIIQLFVTNHHNTIFFDLYGDCNVKSETQFLINYYNHKISIWEPLVDNFNLVFIKKQNNTIVTVKSILNINISEEFIFLLGNSIDSFKIKYDKNTSSKEIDYNEDDVSNHILINLSGNNILIKNYSKDGNVNEIFIKNGDSFDVNNLYFKNLHFEFNRGFSNLLLENYLDEISFSDRVWIKKFSFNSTSENYDSQIKYLISNDIFYVVEVNKIRRNYIFYSKYVIENSTEFNMLIIDRKNVFELKCGGKVGLGTFDNYSNVFELIYDDNKCLITYEDVIKSTLLNSILYVTLKNNHGSEFAHLVIQITKEKVQNLTFENEIIRIKINPTYEIKNFLNFKLNLSSILSREMNLTIKNGDQIHLYSESDTLDNVEKMFKYEIGEGDNCFVFDCTEYYRDSKNISTLSNSDNNFLNERSNVNVLKNINDPNKKFTIKTNYHILNGIIKIFIYCDYLIVNTLANIYPVIPSIQVNDEMIVEKVKFNHIISENNKNDSFEYFYVGDFQKCQFSLTDINNPDKIFKSEIITILPENYAFSEEIHLENITNIYDQNSYKFIIERYIKYVKFIGPKKIDLLIIKPKFQIRNNLNYDIMIFSHDNKNNQYINTVIKRHSNQSIHSKNSVITFKVILDDNKMTNETEAMKCDIVLSQQIVLNEGDTRVYLNVINELQGLTSFMTISETTLNNSLILLENQTDMKIVLYQLLNNPDEYINTYTLNNCETSIFNWTKICISKYIKIDLVDILTNYTCDYYVLSYDNITDKSSNKFSHNFKIKDDILIEIYNEGNVQKITFKNKNNLNKHEYENEMKYDKNVTLIDILSQFIININEVNLCIINYDPKFNNIRRELANLNVNKLFIILVEQIRNKCDHYKLIEIKLGEIQLDNMSKNSISPYRINLFKIKNNSEKNVLPFLHYLMEIKDSTINKNFTIEKLEFLIQSFGVCLDSEFLYDVSIFIKSLQLNFSTTIYYDNNNEIIDVLIRSYLNNINRSNDYDDKIFINLLRTSPINFLLSYKNISNTLFNELNIKSSIIQNIIDVFTNNERVNVKLKAIEINKVYGNKNEIINKIFNYYSYNLVSQALKLFFSIDLLGNPINLLQNLGSGVKDFFFMPVQGIINGPYEFISGSIYGTKSLVSHTLGGALYSTEKISSSIGKNLLKLSNSEDYMKERQLLFLSTQNGGSVFKTSFKIIYLGLKYGARDFIFLPYFYYKNHGFLNLPKGVIYGITSLIVKPINGMFDFLSFFSGGLSRRFLEAYETTFHNLKMKRNPRVFWGVNKHFRCLDSQNEIISSMITFLEHEISNYNEIRYKSIFDKNILIKNIFFIKRKNSDIILTALFINESIFILDSWSNLLIKIINLSEINNLNLSTESIKFILKNTVLGEYVYYEINFDNETIKENFTNYILLVLNKQR